MRSRRSFAATLAEGLCSVAVAAAPALAPPALTRLSALARLSPSAQRAGNQRQSQGRLSRKAG